MEFKVWPANVKIEMSIASQDIRDKFQRVNWIGLFYQEKNTYNWYGIILFLLEA